MKVLNTGRVKSGVRELINKVATPTVFIATQAKHVLWF